MKQKEILRRCREKGIDYSFMHVYRIGLERGFFIKGKKDGNFVEEKFNQWLDEVNISLPEDCIYLKDAAKENGISYQLLRYRLNKISAGIFKDDIPHNRKFYARKEDVSRALEGHNGNVS